MADREKVIEQLESMRDYHRSISNNITADIANDAVELLKEQEAVEPITQSVYNSDEWFYVCGSCKKGVIGRGDKFCRWCGQAVKWK